ncbi:hypothetical protein SISSUDRAFT_1053218 [Sistotremastrum suecicum HHB10207 ss-3]|uniref:Tc1-like transposase DDE domain-containing protein n=1 Tax=Sistotremastrum suecicum HHB10207 ss-3 TaxID=1314776 RepID=A0A165ZCD4_9AGAM|nr:hypothetical protein SISSUDRAFT_1053218 [Sistotremastrum suecicum HHB10207 ss-3]
MTRTSTTRATGQPRRARRLARDAAPLEQSPSLEEEQVSGGSSTDIDSKAKYWKGIVAEDPLALTEVAEILEKTASDLVHFGNLWRSLRRSKPLNDEDESNFKDHDLVNSITTMIRLKVNYKASQLVFFACAWVYEESRNHDKTSNWVVVRTHERVPEHLRGCRRYYLTVSCSHTEVNSKVEEFSAKICEGMIETVLEGMKPYPKENSVVVVDKREIRDVEKFENQCHESGIRVEFLPSNDMESNPAERTFALLQDTLDDKETLSALNMKPANDMDFLGGVMIYITFNDRLDIESWYQKCGYWDF